MSYSDQNPAFDRMHRTRDEARAPVSGGAVVKLLTAAQQRAALAALEALTNDVRALQRAFRDELIDVIGETNFRETERLREAAEDVLIAAGMRATPGKPGQASEG